MADLIIDLFAGLGGWDLGARWAGLPDPVGFEWMAEACATRAEVGLATVRADLATYPTEHLRGRVRGLIASPPCQAFSTAGKGAGRDDPRGELVDVPLRWALDLLPEWCAWEQVPPVLPIWEEHAYALEAAGYRCWTGIVCAADYGVPQTRRRAILLARRDRRPVPPMHTHDETGGLFTERWISMAAALGWGRRLPSPTLNATPIAHGRSPAPTFAPGHDAGGWTFSLRDVPESASGWVVETQTTASWGAKDPEPYQRPLERPAPTVDSSAGSKWKFTLDRRQTGAPTVDAGERPAPTLTGGAIGKRIWKVDAEAPPDWPSERPATTIAGCPRCWPPGHKINADDIDRLGAEEATARYGDRAGTEAIKLTIADALILQSFPPDYPVQGSRTAQFLQVGNAVPPRLAAALLAEVSISEALTSDPKFA